MWYIKTKNLEDNEVKVSAAEETESSGVRIEMYSILAAARPTLGASNHACLTSHISAMPLARSLNMRLQ
jgi:hypothetical protein